MSNKSPKIQQLIVTTKDVMIMTGLKYSAARKQLVTIHNEHKDLYGKPIKFISIEKYAEWSGIDADQIKQLLNRNGD